MHYLQLIKCAQANYKKREKETIETIKHKCELDTNQKINNLCKKYDESLERLLLK